LFIGNASGRFIYTEANTRKTQGSNMYTTANEQGIVNNYAKDPVIYYAEYPTVAEQRRYALQGAIATLFVGLLILTTLGVS
jgi:hypothetical protein